MRDLVSRLKLFLDGMLKVGQASIKEEPEADLIELIHKAHKDWEAAVNNFNYCIEQDMIDYSIYNMEAAEKKFVCLVRIAKKQNLTVDLPIGATRVEVE